MIVNIALTARGALIMSDPTAVAFGTIAHLFQPFLLASIAIENMSKVPFVMGILATINLSHRLPVQPDSAGPVNLKGPGALMAPLVASDRIAPAEFHVVWHFILFLL